MPTYKVTDPNTGKTLRLTGESAPTEAELKEIFSNVSPDAAPEENMNRQMRGFDEESKPKNWVLAGLEQTKRDLIDIPAMHFGNQYAMNAPRAIANKMGYDFPEAESGMGTVLAKGAGVAGALLNPLSALRVMKELQAGSKLLPKIIQGAKAGAIQGAAYTPTEDVLGLPQRAMQGVGGALTGGVLTGASELAQKGVREFRKLKFPAKVSTLKRIARQKQDLQKSLSSKISGAKMETTRNLAKIEAQIQTEKSNTKLLNEEANSVITENVNILKAQLKEATETGAIDIQKKLPDFFRANSDAYGKSLDRISEGIGETFTRGKASKIITDTIGELDEALIQSGKGRKIVDALDRKYSLVKTDADGNILATFDENAPMNFAEFKKDVSSVWKAISSQARAGQKFSEEDLAAAFLQKNFGEYVAQEVPEFAKLQSTYKPVVQGMKEAGKFFKPYAGDFTNIRGGKLLEKAATGKTTPQEERLLQFLSQGSEYAQGLGDLTGQAKTIALRINAAENSMRKGINTPKLQSLLDEQKAIKDKFIEFTIGEKKKVLPRVERLTKRTRRVEDLEANKARALLIKKIIFGTAAGASALLGAGNIGTALMRERLATPK